MSLNKYRNCLLRACWSSCINSPPASAFWPLHVFFFFQAEDGIRDLTVTGVQTCALPIWPHVLVAADGGRRALERLGEGRLPDAHSPWRGFGPAARLDRARHAKARHRRETRSEERRVGKECRSRWSPYH